MYLHFSTVPILLDHSASRLAKPTVLTVLVVCHRLEIVMYTTLLSGLDLISVVTTFSLGIIFTRSFSIPGLECRLKTIEVSIICKTDEDNVGRKKQELEHQ